MFEWTVVALAVAAMAIGVVTLARSAGAAEEAVRDADPAATPVLDS